MAELELLLFVKLKQPLGARMQLTARDADNSMAPPIDKLWPPSLPALVAAWWLQAIAAAAATPLSIIVPVSDLLWCVTIVAAAAADALPTMASP